MAYELEGTVKVIEETQTFGSGFSKKEFVVTVAHEKYPQDIGLEIVQDRISQLDDVKVGDKVDVKFDIRGREYNGKYFNNLQAWNVKVLENAPDAPVDEGDEIPFNCD